MSGLTNKVEDNFRPTLLEKTLVLLHLPPTLGMILVAVFVGPLGNFLYLYAVSNRVTSALYGTFISLNAEDLGFATAVQSNWYSLAGNVLWYVFLFYVAFIMGHLRTHLLKAEPELASLAPNGERDVHDVFKVVSDYVPQIVIMLIFLFVFATSVPELIGKGELTLFSTPIYVLRSSVRSLMFSSVLWLYGASLWGLYCFGKQNLKLRSYEEDPLLGTRRLGSLSFTISSTYFLWLILFVSQMIFGGLAGQTSIVNIVFMLILVPVGIALFIAPLVSAHTTMLKVKRAEIASTNKLLSELISRVRGANEKDDQNMIRLLALETSERKVLSIRTWPVENPLIGRLALITGMVAATLIARLIQVLLHI